MPSPLPLRLTLDELAHLAEPRPEVELHGLDMGWYIVRLHRDDSVSLLSTAQGEIPSWLST
ncbi:MAG: hypothetical protein GBQ79_14150 [Halomonas sp.]|nr:hypothetical protein [Halomonas sp.]